MFYGSHWCEVSRAVRKLSNWFASDSNGYHDNHITGAVPESADIDKTELGDTLSESCVELWRSSDDDIKEFNESEEKVRYTRTDKCGPYSVLQVSW